MGSSSMMSMGTFYYLGILSNWANLKLNDTLIHNFQTVGIALNCHKFNKVSINRCHI